MSASILEPQVGTSAREIVNAFTVDVEDYFQVSAFEKHVRRDQWDQYESRVVRNTHRILQLLDRHGVRATFFVLGWVAHRYPGLVRDIHSSGHEIGSHGYWHRLIYEQSPEEFRSDLRESRKVLEDATGQRVIAYRAPSFSITKRSLWALEVLVEEGFCFDSSIFPIHHDRYGIPGAQTTLHQIATSAGPIWEFPAATIRIAGVNLPVGGGGYFRLLPLRWTLRCLASINRVRKQSFIFYIHPWELDPGQPRFADISPISQFRHYLNLRHTESKLGAVLREFRLAALGDVVRQETCGGVNRRSCAGHQGGH